MPIFALSESAEVALVNAIATLVFLFVSRYLSHREHKRTERKLDTIIQNGKNGQSEATNG